MRKVLAISRKVLTDFEVHMYQVESEKKSHLFQKQVFIIGIHCIRILASQQIRTRPKKLANTSNAERSKIIPGIM